ncbi:MAG TPA: tagatose 1,6-diphosphate aldolase [Candidatus Acidoferrum sp.]|nr:tagatose 1,6-diphosphate aldolase [Candidatus Acidoferrum sp.]
MPALRTTDRPGTSGPRPGDERAEAIGRQRRLLRLGDARGVVAGIAIDHRDSLRVMLERRGSGVNHVMDLPALKLILARALAPAATAIMLDAELGGRALEARVVPATVGLIMPLEAQGYQGTDGPRTRLQDDFSPAEAVRYGADACKVLLPYRSDDAGPAAEQEALVSSTVAACHELGLPLVVEPVVYERPEESHDTFAAAYPGLVVAAVERLGALGVDLLKLPFPILNSTSSPEASSLEACRAVDDACRGIPWVLLGAGVETAVFIEQVRLAGTSGASGFLAGRGIWGAALDAEPGDIERIAATTCRADLERCRAVAEQFAQPLASTRIG